MTTEQTIIKTKVGVREISRRKPNLHNRRAPDLDAAIVAMAIDEPAWGQLDRHEIPS